MSFIWRKFEGCSKCAMSTVTGVIAYVMRNVFSHARKTDSDMSSHDILTMNATISADLHKTAHKPRHITIIIIPDNKRKQP